MGEAGLTRWSLLLIGLALMPSQSFSVDYSVQLQSVANASEGIKRDLEGKICRILPIWRMLSVDKYVISNIILDLSDSLELQGASIHNTTDSAPLDGSISPCSRGRFLPKKVDNGYHYGNCRGDGWEVKKK
jgi:hypothetical protein